MTAPLRRLARTAALAISLIVTLALVSACSDTVPDVVGQSPAQAVKTISETGMTVGEITFIDSGAVELGTVASQDPAAGNLFEKGDRLSIAIAVRDGNDIVMPDLQGMTAQQADRLARITGSEITKARGMSEEIPPGLIGEQRPAAGETLRPGDPVLVVESTGSSKVRAKVPQVAGLLQQEARRQLREEGFQTETLEVYDPNVGRGRVITQIPKAGAERLPGSVVRIIVAAKRQRGMTEVPAAAGIPAEQAAKMAQDAGLRTRILERNTESFAKGLVLEQFPAAGTPIPRGTLVVFLASAGPPKPHVLVPDVVGLEYDRAVAELKAAGLKSVAWPTPPREGFVIREQFPQAGASATEGNRVVIIP